MKIKELEKYCVLNEMCYLILNNTNNDKFVAFYSFYFENDIKWFNENIDTIIEDFSNLYNNGILGFALKYWNLKYSYLYKDIIDEGADWFNE